jgi:DNA polymerase III alpha subunit (gram-positive type)
MIDDDQIYVVVDIEADGPVAGLYSMLSLGAVATTKDKEVSSFYRKIFPLDGASQNPSTMEWWKSQPEAWREVTTDAQSADAVINEFCEWIESLGREAVFVAHPVAFDYAMVSWYLWKFAGRNPFAGEEGDSRTLDLSSFIAGKYDLTLDNAKRKNLPDQLTQGMPEHSHNALDDAKGYGVILRNVLINK